MKKPIYWEKYAEWGSDILGTGQAWGDMRGKVKTRQIGFVRNDGVSKVANVRAKKAVQQKTGANRRGKAK